MKIFTLSFLILFISSTSMMAQEVLIPDGVSTSVGEFSLVTCNCPIENIIMGYDATSDETTTFPFETTVSFTSTGIGYISEFDAAGGVLTFTFDTPAEIFSMLVWNAYFTIELDHSINEVDAIFYDADDAMIETQSVVVPIADENVNTPSSTDFTPVAGVSKIELHVNSLHGGNEISLRRIAFMGTQTIVGVEDISPFGHVSIYPNPAQNQVVVSADNLDQTSINLFNNLGQKIDLIPSSNGSQFVMDVSELSAGTYVLQLRNGDNVNVEKLVIH